MRKRPPQKNKREITIIAAVRIREMKVLTAELKNREKVLLLNRLGRNLLLHLSGRIRLPILIIRANKRLSRYGFHRTHPNSLPKRIEQPEIRLQL